MRVRVPPAEQKEKDMQLKVFTAFSGYDSQCMAPTGSESVTIWSAGRKSTSTPYKPIMPYILNTEIGISGTYAI